MVFQPSSRGNDEGTYERARGRKKRGERTPPLPLSLSPTFIGRIQRERPVPAPAVLSEKAEDRSSVLPS